MKRNRWLALGLSLMVIVIYLVVATMVNSLPQSSFYRLTEVSAPGAGQRILVFTPHPDDESIAVGGYLTTCQEAGAQVRVVLVTDGNRRGLRDKRYQEFRQATGRLGIPDSALVFWGYPDGKLLLQADKLESQVEAEISSFKPDIVVYSHPEDQHPDHAILGSAIEKALANRQDLNIKAYAYLVHFKYYPGPGMLTHRQFLLPPISMAKHNESWAKVILTPEEQRAKFEAIHCYTSQLRNPFLKPLFIGLMRGNELLALRSSNL